MKILRPIRSNSQIAALPLGSRVKLNPWDKQITLVKTQSISLLSARDKLPFEITPFMIQFARFKPPGDTQPPAAAPAGN